MDSKNTTANWLDRHHINGVELSMAELLYYQSKTALLKLDPRRALQARLAGSYLTKMKGRGMEFDEARHYQAGDDIRAIDWRVTARTGKTHTKLFREERERPIFIMVDFSRSMHFGTQLLFKSVQAAHLAALIAWSAAKRGDRIGGLVFNDACHREFKPMTRQKAVLRFLNGLKELQKVPVTEAGPKESQFEDACSRIRRLAHPGSAVILISDFQSISDKAQQHISRISRHCEIMAYRISDPFEHQLPSVNSPQLVSLTDGQNRQSFFLGEKQQAETYRIAHQKSFDHSKELLLQSHAMFAEIDAGIPLEEQLIKQIKNS